MPCPCFFRIARDAKVPFDKIVDVGMFDVRYLKLFDAKYGCEHDEIANMLYEAQLVCQSITIISLSAPVRLNN